MGLSSLSATEVSFLMVAVIQAVAAVVWALGAWAVAEARRAALYWSAWAALSSVTWVVLAMQLQSPPLIGVVCGVLAAMALQRGIRAYIGRAQAPWLPLALLALVVAVGTLAEQPTLQPVHAVVNFGVLACIYFGTARDLYRHGRDDLHLRVPLLLTLPVLLGAMAFASRSLRALLAPDSVLAEMQTHSALNVGSALSYVVLVLMLHAMLMALVTARLVTNLHRLSRHDGLTGMLNRRAIEEALAAQMQRSLRSGEVFAVMMLDIDHFKAINDRHGHAVGDLALKHAAGLLRGDLREVDRLGRYGGEEFLLLLPGLPLVQAHPVAERLREQLASRPLLHGGETIALSVSIGIAEWSGDKAELPRVLAHADAALYRAKAAGRNRVVAQGAAQGTVQVAWSGPGAGE